MQDLILDNGTVDYGLFEEEIENISFQGFDYYTPMGYKLPGFLKRYKVNQFNFFGICGPDIILGLAVIDLKYLGSGFVYIYDRNTGELFEEHGISPLRKDTNIVPSPKNPHSSFKKNNLELQIKKDRIYARGKSIELDVGLQAEETNPLRLCTRTGYTGWSFTQKTTPIPINGQVNFDAKSLSISSPQHMGVMDWSGGYMRRHTFWNWACSASRLPNGSNFGLNLSCGVNETSFTENAFWIDGRRFKVDTVNFEYDKNDLLQPWRITSNDGRVDMTFIPEQSRSERTNALFLATKFTQLMGLFQGTVVLDNAERVEIADCYGWTEDHYAKW